MDITVGDDFLVFVFKTFPINMCLISAGYGVMAA